MKSAAVCKPLPQEISKQINTSENREQYVTEFLKKCLPYSDIDGISTELRKTYIFDKMKSHTGQVKIRPKKSRFLSARQRKLLGMNQVGAKGQLKYSEILALNKLWLEYMMQALGVKSFEKLPTSFLDPRWEAINQKIMKADFHGAKITIIRSKCPSLIGIEGIIIQDTKNTFRVISDNNVIRTVPKHIVVLKIHLMGATLVCYGKELCYRPAERSVKKFKANHFPEL